MSYMILVSCFLGILHIKTCGNSFYLPIWFVVKAILALMRERWNSKLIMVHLEFKIKLFHGSTAERLLTKLAQLHYKIQKLC